MKKFIFTILLTIVLSGIGYAQQNQNTVSVVDDSDLRSNLIFGVKLGTNYSNVYDSHGDAFSAYGKFGLAGGMFLAVPIGKYFGIQPEILFSQKGFNASGNIANGAYNFTRTTDYIDIPIFIAVKPSEFLTLLAGPQYSYLLRQRDVFTNGSTSITSEDAFQNDNIRKNILSFACGFDLTLKQFVLGMRAGWDVLNNNGNGTSNTPQYKNAWLQATVGYRFY